MQSEIEKSKDQYQLKKPLKVFVHDLKNPLSAINGFIDLLEDTGLNKDQQEIVNYIRKANKNACSVLDEEITALYPH